MLKLDLVFSGLGITKRDDIYLSRSIDSFGNLLDNINGLPLVLEHPQDLETHEKSLLHSNTDYVILGYIESVNSISEDCIRVNACIIDPRFIEFYESLTEEQKATLHISPAVSSEIIDPVEIDGNVVYKEIINKLDHLAIVSHGYWMRYVDQQPVLDIVEEPIVEETISNDIENIDFVGTVESTSNLNIEDNDEQNNNILLNNNNEDSNMEQEILENKEKIAEILEHEGEEAKQFEQLAEDHTKLVDSECASEESKAEDKIDEESEKQEESDKIDEEEKPEEAKCDSEESKQEESKIDSECSSQEEDKIDEESEQEIEKEVEEIKEENEKVDSEEELQEALDEDTDISEEDKELLVKIVGNLVDSVEGFRKAKYDTKTSVTSYVKNTLKLNKQFIDKKYHSLLDSIDSSSIEFGKDLLTNISPETVKNVKRKSQYEYTKIANNHFRRKFF